jgi:adenylylsulfate kinase
MSYEKGRVVWLYGLSGAGKTTICNSAASLLRRRSMQVQILDSDELRGGLCSDLGFSTVDRMENIRRLSHIAALLAKNGTVVLVAAITPLQAMREQIRALIPHVIEAFVDAPLDVCEARDPKGLYKRARSGALKEFTGINSPFEWPDCATILCHTDIESVDDCASNIVDAVLANPIRGSLVERRRPTVAVDLDGVIADYDGWKGYGIIGTPRQDVVDALASLRSEGWKVVVHTTRGAHEVKAYLDLFRIPYDEINRNSDYYNWGDKPVATVYWDDRAVCYTGNAVSDISAIRRFRTWSNR